MNENAKKYIEEFLSKFQFIRWDRFTQKTVQDRATRRKFIIFGFYGWIDRKDSYKDFVAISVRWPDKLVDYVCTSSATYSKTITDMVGLTHIDCQRVEHSFEIPNSIKLLKVVEPKVARIP